MSSGREGSGWVRGLWAGTHPQVGARDGVWSDWLPLLRAFLPETDAVACDGPSPRVQWGLPPQHQGSGPHLKRPHIIRGSCGTWVERGWATRQAARQPNGHPDRWVVSWAVSQQACLSISHNQAWQHLLWAEWGPAGLAFMTGLV